MHDEKRSEKRRSNHAELVWLPQLRRGDRPRMANLRLRPFAAIEDDTECKGADSAKQRKAWTRHAPDKPSDQAKAQKT